MRIFITGSTGRFGRVLTRAALELGYEVVALYRSAEKAERLFGQRPNLTLVQGDLEHIAAFESELRGCDVVMHTAAIVAAHFLGDAGTASWDRLEKINVRAVVELLDAADRAHVGKFIHVSSAALVGKDTDGKPGDELSMSNGIAEADPYLRSKLHAQREIATWLQAHAMPVVQILPAWMHGPALYEQPARRDSQWLQIRLISPGGRAIVDARDVAQAMLNAIGRGRRGQRYIISAGYHSLSDIRQLEAACNGQRAICLKIPYGLAMMLARLEPSTSRLRQSKTIPSLLCVRQMQQKHDVNGMNSVIELGLKLHTYDQMLADARALASRAR